MLLSFVIGFFSFALIILFVIFSGSCVPETRNAVMMFLNTVLPAMFPFYVLSSIIVSSGFLTRVCAPLKPAANRILKLPACCIAAVILGCLCGFPIGAKITCDLKERGDITAEQAARLSSFTNNVGPIFMASIVGGAYFGSIRTGLLLWLSVTIASALSGVFICRFRRSDSFFDASGKLSAQANKIDIPASILSSMNTVLYVGAVIIFFSSVTSLLKLIPGISNFTYGTAYSFLEITGGLNILAAEFHPNNLLWKFMLISACSAWSGCSVHMQVCGILLAGKVDIRYYFAGKILQTILAPLIISMLFVFF
ncbi:MAG: hypothetical protein ACLSVG_05960 [Clostridia bacterium]